MANRRLRFDLLALIAAVLAFYAPVLFGGRAYFERDITFFLHERLLALAACLRAGAWPLWNPYAAFGEPLLGIANAGVAYPTSWLILLFSPAVTHTLIVVLHVTVAALGARSLARRCGATPLAAVAAGALFALSGPVQSALTQTNVLIGAAWIPWAWLGFRKLDEGEPKGAVLAGLALALAVLGGSPESALMGAAGVAFALPTSGLHPDRLRRAARGLVTAVALGLGLSAVQWLPTLALAAGSARAGLTAAQQAFWSLHPLALAQLVLPVTLDDLPLRADLRGLLFEGREPLLPSLYLGLAAPLLALVALVGRRDRTSSSLAALGAGGLVLALGRHTPVWGLLHALPPLQLVRFPARFVVATALAGAVLAALGWDFVTERPRGRALQLLAGAGVLALAFVCLVPLAPGGTVWSRVLESPAALGYPWAADPAVRTAWASLQSAALCGVLVAALLVAAALSRTRSRALGSAALVLLVVDVALAARPLNPTAPLAAFAAPVRSLAPVPAAPPNRTLVLPYAPAQAAAFLGRPSAFSLPLEADDAARLRVRREYPSSGGVLPPIESLPEDVPLLRNAGVQRWIDTLRALRATPVFPRLVANSGVAYVLALQELPASEGLQQVAQTALFDATIRTYRVPGALPCALATTGVAVATEQAAFDVAVSDAFDPRRTVILGAGEPRPALGEGTITRYEPGFDSVSLDVALPAAGHVVLLEAWDPGWRVRVDGVPAAVERADLAFRAVAVPAGAHRVEFAYRPPQAVAGALVSLATAVLALALFLRR